MNQITKFEGEHAFLSNFFVEPDGSTVEHEFQAAKVWALESKVAILSALTPGKAKRMGRNVRMRSDWSKREANGQEVRVNIMRDLVFKKFWDSEELSGKLAATESAILIEGNHWHDNFWGDCSCSSCPAPGENHLGIILMEVRLLVV